MDSELEGEPQVPLKGIRVIDITTMITGPLCSQQLGDLGADVVKIEPLHGEVARWMTPPLKAGLTGYYCQINRNKRSLAIDLKNPKGVAIVKRLAASADVLVENFRGGVPDKLGIGYDDLKPLNDRLIYASITGFGSSGPNAHLPAYDMLMQGLSGMMYIEGGGPDAKPKLMKSAMVDKTTAVSAAGAVLAALYARDGLNGTGKGQRVDVPMIDAFASTAFADIISGDTFIPSDVPAPAPIATLRTWDTSDGYIVGMALMDDHFKAFCEALECPELMETPGCRTMGERTSDWEFWLDKMAEVIARFSTQDALHRLVAAGVPFGPVKTIREFCEEPQVKHNRTIFHVEHEEAGTMQYVRYPAHFESSPASLHRHPPRLGEHSVELLLELGCNAEEIEALVNESVIGTYKPA